jgi:hypothetical protein
MISKGTRGRRQRVREGRKRATRWWREVRDKQMKRKRDVNLAPD